MWLLVHYPRRRLVWLLQEEQWTAPFRGPVQITNPGKEELKTVWERTAGDSHLFPGMEKLIGRKGKQAWSTCLYQQTESEHIHDNNGIIPTKSFMGRNPGLLWLWNQVQTRKCEKTWRTPLHVTEHIWTKVNKMWALSWLGYCDTDGLMESWKARLTLGQKLTRHEH